MLVPYTYVNISPFWRLDRLWNAARLRGHAAVRGTAQRIASAARVVRTNASLCGEARRLRATHATESSCEKDWLVVKRHALVATQILVIHVNLYI